MRYLDVNEAAKYNRGVLSKIAVPFPHSAAGGQDLPHFDAVVKAFVDEMLPFVGTRRMISKPFTCDEAFDAIKFKNCNEHIERIHAVSNFSVRGWVTSPAPVAQDFHSNLDTICPLLNFVHNNMSQCDDYPKYSEGNRIARGDYNFVTTQGEKVELWWYISCMSYGCSPKDPFKPSGCHPENKCPRGWPTLKKKIDEQNNCSGIAR